LLRSLALEFVGQQFALESLSLPTSFWRWRRRCDADRPVRLDAAESAPAARAVPTALLRFADSALPSDPYTFTGSKGAIRVHLSPA